MHALISLVSSALVGGAVQGTPVLQGADAFADSGTNLPIARCVHEIVSDVGCFQSFKVAKQSMVGHT